MFVFLDLILHLILIIGCIFVINLGICLVCKTWQHCQNISTRHTLSGNNNHTYTVHSQQQHAHIVQPTANTTGKLIHSLSAQIQPPPTDIRFHLSQHTGRLRQLSGDRLTRPPAESVQPDRTRSIGPELPEIVTCRVSSFGRRDGLNNYI